MLNLPNLTEKEWKEVQELNGKWIAVLLQTGRAEDPTIIRDENKILADENLINIQARAGELYPELTAKNKNGKKVKYCYIPEKLNHQSNSKLPY